MLLHVSFSLMLINIGSALASSPWSSSNCKDNRVAIVHLFEWKWTDIAAECERFLGAMGYCGVQVSPPHEHIKVYAPEPHRPWWERYQPVSYKLHSRSGDEQEFTDMVHRCNAAGVRVYVDTVINHMCESGRSGVGTGGSFYDCGAHYFPGVPFTAPDFNDCSCCQECCCVDNWQDHCDVRNCRLWGRMDLNSKVSHVQDMITGYMNKLIDLGVAGFRVDAAKHMWPEDLETLWNKLNNLNNQWFPAGARAFVFLEVIDMNQQGEIQGQEYTHVGRVTDFRYCSRVKQASGALWDIPNMYDPGWGMLPSEDAFVFVDNHGSQRDENEAIDVLTFKDPRNYTIAQAITHGWTHGYPRIMSSYDFVNASDPPPMNEDETTKDVVIKPDGSCDDGWICEHRWKPIAGMASFAKATSGTGVANFWSGGNNAAWQRPGKGFIAIANEGIDQTFDTGLPAGDYCNVIQGCATDSGCIGETVRVDGSGTATITVVNGNYPILAIHVEAMSGSSGCISGVPAPTGPTTQPTTMFTTPETTTRSPPDTTSTYTSMTSQSTADTTSPETTTRSTTATTSTTAPTTTETTATESSPTTTSPLPTTREASSATIPTEYTTQSTAATTSRGSTAQTTSDTATTPAFPETTAKSTAAATSRGSTAQTTSDTATTAAFPETTAKSTAATTMTTSTESANQSTAQTTTAITSTSTTPQSTPTSPVPTLPAWRRTVVFVLAESQVGQDLFLKGGINHVRRPGCTDDPETSACAMSISHNPLGIGSHYEKYNAWRVGDTKLNWYGKQVNQGSWQGQDAEGSPSVWTTNNQGHPGYQPLNRWGDHCWMIDFDMDCSQGEAGWFEFKSFATGHGWEGDISQGATCTGTAGGARPYSAPNHFGRCGYLNVFEFEANTCLVDTL